MPSDIEAPLIMLGGQKGTWRGRIGYWMLRDRAARSNCPVQVADVGHGWAEDPAILTVCHVSDSWL